MGIREFVVMQKVTEMVCDLCKQKVDDDGARIGQLTTRAPGKRGRPASVTVVFHAACLSRIVDSPGKARSLTNGGRGVATAPARGRGRAKSKRAKSSAK